MSEIYCKYCYKYWKLKREYDKHLSCCEFFYNLRRNPPMENYNGKIPTVFELAKLVEELATRVDKQDKEIARLKTQLQSKQKRVITEILNQPGHLPKQTFQEWVHSLVVGEIHLQRVFKFDLTEGIKSVLETHIALAGGSGGSSGKTRLPIRTFAQKPGIFYVYIPAGAEGDGGCPTGGTASGEKAWKAMTTPQFDTMLMYISQLFLREFFKWQKENITALDEDNEDKKAQELTYMIKINGMKTSADKRAGEVKKWLFQHLEENANVLNCEFV